MNTPLGCLIFYRLYTVKDTTGNLQFNIPTGIQEHLLEYLDKPVILGVRSENVTDKNESASIPFQGAIATIELLGNEQIIAVKGFSDAVISRVSTKKVYGLGDKVELFMDISSIYFFDKESENRVV